MPALFATCPKGLELLLADELRALGASDVHEARAGVHFNGDREIAYRACLWSRLASRILVPLQEFPAHTPEELYEGVQAINWDQHLAPDGTLAVDFTASASQITHSHYGALKVKDAIVDQLRDLHGVRPSIDTARPDVRVNIYLHRDQAILSLDLSGEALHRRGYRADAVEAPLKENLAAAMLLRAGWPEVARAGGELVDLMCGSGTLLVEAAMMATDTAPGLDRPYFGFLNWRQHDAPMWEKLLTDARTRRDAGMAQPLSIRGYDADTRAIRIAETNIVNAGFGRHIKVTRGALADCQPQIGETGLVAVNPPYGERLGEASELPALYAELGTQLKRCFPGWHASILTGNPELGKNMGLRAKRYHVFWNGAIECRLLHFDVTDEWHVTPRDPTAPIPLSDGAKIFENRLHKDLKHFGRWARRQDIHAYRVYDADLHEYNVAIDVYESDRRYVHVQEYEAPKTVDPRRAERRLREALTVIPQVLEIPAAQMFVKQRRRQRDGAQYEKLDDSGEFHEVREGAARLLVNFGDYLDTGLFLDHRATRLMIGELASGKSFLNLFGYTASATVHAALGGATSTVTVDMSNTYLDWARRNFELNGLRADRHELVRADVLKGLKDNRERHYGLIFLDPPTFSRSKSMDDTLDIQRDHVELIRHAAALLEPDGTLIFSTNLRRFKIERDALNGLDIDDITRRTIPPDFERNPKIHQCFRIRRASA
ncbi:MAG TPA: bifunctional 23S rRNA (guanine(2069)-N(7))-methyltransferase RlmK/23S rRNA (guanine(2445)-N(2))-methyltransferase RlmL [Burkholderiales bacterium]|nr:bifunctional 23S rRNA (guanine(2069)-N(7))-methyltransferase RlmK/23S rRNA (guanine(2445)-N(2))-methyltransferase RlmL [Burkholderiales bacterium]